MRKEDKDIDKLIRESLQASVPEMDTQRRERLVAGIMKSLPEHKRQNVVVALMLRYVQSPLWMLTAILVGLVVCWDWVLHLVRFIATAPLEQSVPALLLIMVVSVLAMIDAIKEI